MIILIVLYLLPIIFNLIAFKDTFNSLKTVVTRTDAIVAYSIICFMPMINLWASIYIIVTYVYEILRKD